MAFRFSEARCPGLFPRVRVMAEDAKDEENGTLDDFLTCDVRHCRADRDKVRKRASLTSVTPNRIASAFSVNGMIDRSAKSASVGP